MPTKPDHNRLMRLYNRGLNDRQIAEKVGVTNQTIWKWRKKNNLKPNYYSASISAISAKEHQKRLVLYNQGLNDREIGKLLGVTNQPIMRWRRKHGLKSNYKSPGSPGSRRDKILDLYNEGLTDKQIANKLDLTRREVRYYRQRKLKLPHLDNKSKELKRLLKAGHSAFEIAQMYGVPKSVLNNWLWKYKIKIRSGKPQKKPYPNPPPSHAVVGTKLCEDCGEEFKYAYSGAIRCPKCRGVKQDIYFACRDAWRTVGTWSDNAKKKLRKKIVEEDGEEMAHLVMNGMGK